MAQPKFNENQIDIDWLPDVLTYLALLDIPTGNLRDGVKCYVAETDIIYAWDIGKGKWITPNNILIPARLSGWYDSSQVTLTLTGDNQDTVTITPVSGSFKYYFDGELVIITGSKSVTLPDVGGGTHSNGTHFIYFDDATGTPKISQVPWDIEATVQIAIVFWYQGNAQGYRALLANELHTVAISRRAHKIGHFNFGTQKISGGTLSGYTLKESSQNAMTFGISQTNINDEDIFMTLDALVDGVDKYTVMCHDSQGIWSFVSGNTVPFRYQVGGRVLRDSLTGHVQVASGKFINSYILATNFSGEARYINIFSQVEYNNPADAYTETMKDLNLNHLPLNECVVIGQITWGVNDGYTGIGKCRIERVLPLSISILEIKNSNAIVTLASAAPVLGYIIGARLSYVNTTTVQVDEGILEIGGLSYQISTPIQATWDTTEGGITRQANTWYYVYAQPNPSDTTSFIPFISTVAPTKNQFGQTILSHSNSPKYHPTLNARFVGSFKTNASNQIMQFIIIGTYIAFIGQGYNYILQNGTAGTKTAVNCRSLVPITSSLAQVYYELGSGNNSRYIGDSTSWYLKAIGGSGALLIPVTNNSIYYQCDGNAVSLGIHGYYEIV